MKLKNIIKIAILAPAIIACDDMFEPGIENNQDFETLTKIPANGAGLMMHGYNNLPYQSGVGDFSDVATDDAVTNDYGNNYYKVARGLWSSKQGGVNPVDRWTVARTNIQYVNRFLEDVNSLTFAGKKEVNDMFKEQLTGEAYALRALQNFYFLRAHCGYADGDLLGIPLLTHSETAGDDFNVPRSSFKACIEQIMKDLDKAQDLLPYDYDDITDAQLPQHYKDMGVTYATDYNRVFGFNKSGRISGRIAAAIEAQVAIFAASPAYSSQSGVTYEDAAKRAAEVLDKIGGVAGLDPTGNHWYNNIEDIRAVRGGKVPPEIIWRDNVSENNNLETDCYPASLYGKARINPTQNLVDAFPMANGTPITEAGSGYDAQNPYAGRDPRFDLYIVHDGSLFGPYRNDADNNPISTSIDDEKDGLEAVKGGSPTRTGYFLRKLMNEDCIIKMKDGGSGMSAQHHYNARIRYTEIFLDYAEAANEAFGPTSSASSLGYSAYDVVKAIRQRGGIVNDQYLESIKSDKDKMRELIRNERRIELCFEGHRFWDLRRWKVDLSKLNEPVKAMQIVKDGTKKTYTVVDVKDEPRQYDECMFFGPVPEKETVKWSALKQNDGWEKF